MYAAVWYKELYDTGGVRINGALAQLARASALQAECRGFESLRLHQISKDKRAHNKEGYLGKVEHIYNWALRKRKRWAYSSVG